MPSAPLSVVIPSYNHSRFVGEAIASVLAQSYRPLQLVIIDDGSTDDSVDVIRAAIERHDLDSVLFECQENHGAHEAINRGIALASGEYLSILNSDDRYDPDRFSRLMPIATWRDVGVVFSGVRFIDEDGAALPDNSAWPSWYRRCVEETEHLPTVGYRILVHNYSVTSGNFLFHRELHSRVGGFCRHRFAHDWDFLLRSTYFSEPHFSSAALISYRVHPDSTTETVRHLMQAECRDSTERYSAMLCEPSPNPRAPGRLNWPRFLDVFVRSSKPFYDPAITYEQLRITW